MAPIRGETDSKLAEPTYTEEFVQNEDGDFIVRFKCRTCGTTVSRKADVDRHINDKHRPPKYFCDVPGCKRVIVGFTQESNLNNHKSSVHLNLALYQCPHHWVDPHNGRIFPCRSKYKDRSSLSKHRKDKHGFKTGDDDAKVARPTPFGKRFPDSKGVSRAFTSLSIAGRSSAPYIVPPPSARRSSRMKVSKTVVIKQEQENDTTALEPGAVGWPSDPQPVKVAGWDMGSSSQQLREEARIDDYLQDPGFIALYEALCAQFALRASEALQIPTQVGAAADHYWTVDSQSPALGCHVAGAAFNGLTAPTGPTLPEPSGTTAFEQTNMLNAGSGPFPVHNGHTPTTWLWDESVFANSSASGELPSFLEDAFSTGPSQWMSTSTLGMPENHVCL
ncbi:hypothetical protein BD310DRAFT_698543 [Dichomitus squalens]|uniref:C2H2-type domain-containing protein n=1 Tax=Dichomitus squalens TaxID=114155 RepID=A0A4Q9Q6C0_9APHY|nr:hypothetical protein BD310DRAFT_698543 [Dichomitus squalens]